MGVRCDQGKRERGAGGFSQWAARGGAGVEFAERQRTAAAVEGTLMTRCSGHGEAKTRRGVQAGNNGCAYDAIYWVGAVR
jgi:hypothetical protein